MLDVLSGGRLVAGFIRGVPQNYAAYNVDPNESRDRFEEAFHLIVRAWTDQDVFAWSGKYYNFPKVALWPRPLTRPHPPLVFSANSIQSAVFAARYRIMIGTIHLYTRDALEKTADHFRAYRSQAASDGWEAGPDHFLVGLEACIAPTDEGAEELLRPALHYRYHVLSGTCDKQKRQIAIEKPGYGFSPVEEHPPRLKTAYARRQCFVALPSIAEYLPAGVVGLQLQVGNMPHEAVLTGLSLFRDRVLPRLR
jgi:alkanesulfonate monooxygenase SsuD/methylene tetrahydromethanopterin reductase-like flavin-dependent oxidoreductase (luciferase family)